MSAVESLLEGDVTGFQDQIKSILMEKLADRMDLQRIDLSNALFGLNDSETDDEEEIDDEDELNEDSDDDEDEFDFDDNEDFEEDDFDDEDDDLNESFGNGATHVVRQDGVNIGFMFKGRGYQPNPNIPHANHPKTGSSLDDVKQNKRVTVDGWNTIRPSNINHMIKE